MTQPDKYKNRLITGLILAVVALLFMQLKSCMEDPEVLVKPTTDSTAIWKAIIQKDFIEKDSLKKLAVKKDSVKVEWRIKYVESKTNPGKLPCDSLVPIIVQNCDSALASADDYEALLNYIIQNDSSIIANQRNIIVSDSTRILNDSLLIADLNKQISKHKRHKRILTVTNLITLGAAIIR